MQKAKLIRAALRSCGSLGIALSLAWSGPVVARAPDDRATLMEIEDILMHAGSGKVMAPYLDPETVIWDVNGKAFHGPAAVMQHIDDIFKAPEFKNFSTSLVKADVRVEGSLAFINSIQRLKLTDDSGKILLDTEYRVTNCYHKVKGRWLVLMQHLSFPVDMTTGKVIYGKLDGG